MKNLCHIAPLHATTPEHQRLYFHLQRGTQLTLHLRVTKVRLWRVRDGFPRAETVDDAPPKSNGLYFNNANWSKSYHHAGAAMLRVCFDGFMVENFWDYVEIRDANEHIVQVLTGELSPTIQFCSSWVRGDTLKVRFSSDSSVVRTGFRIYRVESRQAQSLDLRFPGQWVVRQTEVKAASDHALLAPPFHYNWHRFYDPDSARYLTPDLLGLRAGLNPYAYVDADPVNLVDPDGLWLVPLGNLLSRLSPLARRFGPPAIRSVKRFGKNTYKWAKGLFRGRVSSRPLFNTPEECKNALINGSKATYDTAKELLRINPETLKKYYDVWTSGDTNTATQNMVDHINRHAKHFPSVEKYLDLAAKMRDSILRSQVLPSHIKDTGGGTRLTVTDFV